LEVVLLDLYLIESYHGTRERKETIDNPIKYLIEDIENKMKHLPTRRVDTNNLKILDAIYGYKETLNYINVTELIRKIQKENKLNMIANSYEEKFGNPWKEYYYTRKIRYLIVKYSFNEVEDSKTVSEGEPLSLP